MVQLEEDTVSFMVTQKTTAMVDENGFIKVQD